MVATVGVVGAVITFALVTIAQVVWHRLGEAEDERKNRETPRELSAYLDDQERQLSKYRWLDKDAGTVGLPIEAAKALVTQAGGIVPAPAPVEPAKDAPPAELGEGLYNSLGCFACHSLDGSKVVGPTFKGIWGQQRTFTDGTKATVDAAYVKESIVQPQKRMQEGFAPVMPAFEGRVSDADIENLTAFIKAQK